MRLGGISNLTTVSLQTSSLIGQSHTLKVDQSCIALCFDPGKCDLQWSTQTQELSKDIWINTSKGRVETESVRAMKEQRSLLGVVGPLGNWSS